MSDHAPISESIIEQLRLVTDDPLALEDIDEPQEIVPRLSPQAFVRLACKLRDEDRLELLLPHATSEQLTSLFDLDGWSSDRLHLGRCRGWLLAIADSVTQFGERGDLSALVNDMDPEMWTAGLAAATVVFVLDPDDDSSRDRALDQIPHLRAWDTPDGFFVVGVSDDDMGRATLAILDLVYADSLAQGRQLVLSIQSILMAQVEEDLLQWRDGRIADLGFVPWEDAMQLFRPLDIKAAIDADPKDFRYLPDDRETGFYVTSWSGTELLQRVMERLPDAERSLRAREFLLLTNEVMSAQRFPPASEPHQERALSQTQATISLGLDMLLHHSTEHPDPDGFLAECVARIGLRDVFRVGYGALDKLRRAAQALNQAARISLTGPASLLDRPWGPAIAALFQFYPEIAIKSSSRNTRPIKTLTDVARSTQTIREAEGLVRLAYASEGFGISPLWLTRVDEPEHTTLGDLIRTAIVHAHLPGSRTTMAPLGPDELSWAAEHLVDAQGSLIVPVRKDFSARCDALGLGELTEALSESVLSRLAMELRALERQPDGTVDLTKTGGMLTLQRVSLWLTATEGTESN